MAIIVTLISSGKGSSDAGKGFTFGNLVFRSSNILSIASSTITAHFISCNLKLKTTEGGHHYFFELFWKINEQRNNKVSHILTLLFVVLLWLTPTIVNHTLIVNDIFIVFTQLYLKYSCASSIVFGFSLLSILIGLEDTFLCSKRDV